jgi:hypothetical protein
LQLSNDLDALWITRRRRRSHTRELVGSNWTRENGAANVAAFLLPLGFYLFGVYMVPDLPAMRARAAMRPPNARERSSCVTWRRTHWPHRERSTIQASTPLTPHAAS